MRADIEGRIVLVRHELMFVAGTMHRRRKYDMARAAGAVGFLIAGPLPGGAVAGSSGRAEGGTGIPAARHHAGDGGRGCVRRAAGRPTGDPAYRHRGEAQPRRGRCCSTCPARPTNGSCSAPMSTATTSTKARWTTQPELPQPCRRLAQSLRRCSTWRRGVRLAFFSVEEWALTGSARYVEGLSVAEREAIALNINLDSVAGNSRLAALTSGFAHVEPFLMSVAEGEGLDLRCVRPFLPNSDHANFALAGIPAFRLVAGYRRPGRESALRSHAGRHARQGRDGGAHNGRAAGRRNDRSSLPDRAI